MNKKKKILFIINSLYGGGAERVLQVLLNNLSESKYDITVYSVNQCEIDKKIYKSNFKYYYIFSSKKTFISKVRNKIRLLLYYHAKPSLFYKLFIKGIYDVEIAFIEGYATRIVSGSKNKKSKKYAWVHVDLINTPWTNIAYCNDFEEQECYKKFDKILCVSNEVKYAHENKYKSNNCQVQYNSIDEKEIIYKSNLLNIKKSSSLQFVTIGRLVEQKGYDRLLKIVLQLKKEGFEEFNIWILGDGKDRVQLEKYIGDHELENYVSLLGYVDNPYPYIKASDAFICSSRSEGFSTVATEAMILNKPIITTNCAGMKELFGGFECGFICDNNIEAFYTLMKYILCNPCILKKFNDELKARSEFFKLENRLNELEELFCE